MTHRRDKPEWHGLTSPTKTEFVLIQPYTVDELRFAWCYRVYLRWRTHRAKHQPALAKLDLTILQEIGNRYDIHVLEANSNDTDVQLLTSLKPRESVSGCASKLKGQISKWLREELVLSAPANLVSSGYFACTTGKSTSEAVEHYLDQQSDHHSYSVRLRPPIFVCGDVLTPADQLRTKPKHAVTHLQHHVVLATWHRQGVFGQDSGAAVAERWKHLLNERPAALVKVSFVPDHVHLALRVHPSVSPAELIVELMNAAQELMWEQFDNAVIRAGAERLWQASAYLGSYGELESAKISKYVKRWESEF